MNEDGGPPQKEKESIGSFPWTAVGGFLMLCGSLALMTMAFLVCVWAVVQVGEALF